MEASYSLGVPVIMLYSLWLIRKWVILWLIVFWVHPLTKRREVLKKLSYSVCRPLACICRMALLQCVHEESALSTYCFCMYCVNETAEHCVNTMFRQKRLASPCRCWGCIRMCSVCPGSAVWDTVVFEILRSILFYWRVDSHSPKVWPVASLCCPGSVDLNLASAVSCAEGSSPWSMVSCQVMSLSSDALLSCIFMIFIITVLMYLTIG